MAIVKSWTQRLAIALCLMAAGTLLAQDVTDAKGWINRGVSEFKTGHFADAVASFQKAVAAQPSYVTARLYLASALMKQYVPGVETPENRAFADSAEREFRRVLDFEPQNKVALSSLGGLNVSRKKFDVAEQWYEDLIRLDPADTNAWYNMGLLGYGQWHPAYLEARHAIGMKPDEPGPMTDGRVKQDLKARYGPAMETGAEALRHGLLIDPKFCPAMQQLGLLLRERADLDGTAAEYQADVAEAADWSRKAATCQDNERGLRLPDGSRIDVTQGIVGGPPETEPHRLKMSADEATAALKDWKEPVYPQSAQKAGVHGTVNLTVVIGKDGHVLSVKLINGPDPLIQSAMDAVKAWVYEPPQFKGIPVEAETEVHLSFGENKN
jgi:TonB family protein